jgi:carboxyl-terminal processing protease
MKLLKRSFVLIIILMIILIPLNIVEGIDKNTSEDYSEQFKEIMDLITERYLDENVTEKELFDAAIGGMLDSLDEYSVYFTEEEKKVFTNAIERAYVGIGVSLKQEEEYVAIDEVFEGGSASKGGILSGDIIKKINGESAKGYKPSQVSKKVLGKEGTEVTITFERNNKEYDITMKRSVVNLPTVTKLDIKKNIKI